MRPLLAPSQVPSNYPKYWSKLQYPLLGSPKYDGIRGVADDAERMKSRTWIDLPSAQVQELFGASIPWSDGELIEGNPTDFGVYNRTQSFVMSEGKFSDDMRYYVFDYAHPDWRERMYYERLEELKRLVAGHDHIALVEQKLLESYEEVLAFEQECLTEGFEGIMLRTLTGRYKNNRATINEGIIYKLKRFEDAEGVVVDFVERQINNNEQVRDERGYAKRSSHQANKQAAGTLGKFKVRFNGEIINVGPGNLTHAQLQKIWDNQDYYLSRILKFKYFAHGVKDAPRHARALGWRDRIDL